ncbi:MAG: glycosyltransferase family 2 protein [Desulfobacteraceae bacterium]|nr:glycosyltransferase family 2 protein [Desulfobacteraceae bacterium]
MPLTSFIIINWNGKELLPSCIDAILRQSDQSFEIIVVDNGSTDCSATLVRESYPQVILISLARNLGFTGGNIEGLRRATGKYVTLVNNDAILSRNWLHLMVDALESDEAVGLCSSCITIAGTNLIDSAGEIFTTAFSGTKVGELHNMTEFDKRRYVPGACAAAVIYKREMLDDIGFLDDDFFLNHEDTDLNLRAWLAGWKCLYVPEAVVEHRVSTTIGKMSEISVYYFARNSLWVWIKNTPTYFLFRFFHHRIAYELASFLFFCFIARRWRPFLRGKYHSLKGVPRMLLKRKSIQKNIRLTRKEIRQGLIPLGAYLRERLALLDRSEIAKQ